MLILAILFIDFNVVWIPFCNKNLGVYSMQKINIISKIIEGMRQNMIVIVLQFSIHMYPSPIIMLPIPNDIYKKIEYFCLSEFYTVSPIIVIVILMQDSQPRPAKNKPATAIQILKAKLKIKIPKTVIPQLTTIENFLP